jgi:hypothetical protein
MRCDYCGADEKTFQNTPKTWKVVFTCGSTITGNINEIVGFDEVPCEIKPKEDE